MAASFHPPGPPARPIIGYLFNYRRHPLEFLSQLAREYGDLACFKIGGQRVFLLNNPDSIRDVLVTHDRNFTKGRALARTKILLGEGLLTSDGEFHYRQRRLVQPAFHRPRIASYAELMTQYAARASERWRDGETLDIWQEMMRLTLAIAGKTLFDADVEAEATEIGEALTVIMNLFHLMLLPYSELLEKLPLPPARRFAKARDRLDATIYRMIAEHRASGVDRGDLLSMLLMAQDEEGDGGRMTDEQVRDESMTIFLAGHETTANALTWTWYLLSEHPEVETKLHAEVDRVLEGKLPKFDDLPNLRYTEMVVAESMRLYPPAWAVGRRAIRDYPIGKYVAPAGSLMLMSQFVTHRDPKYFPDPLRFDPERWTPEAQAARPKFCYFPFGGGSRYCIGDGFAWTEAILVLATLAQRWQMRLVPGHPVVLQPVVTLRPKHGMRMSLQRR